MININLKKNQVPTQIDIPKKYRKPSIIFIFTISVFLIGIVGITIYYLLFLSSPKHIIITNNLPEKNVQIKKITLLKTKKNHKLSIQKENPQKISIKQKPKNTYKTIQPKEKQFKNPIHINSQQAIFKIALTFEKIQPQTKTSTPPLSTPLPKQLSPTPPKKEKKVNNPSVIYQITVKTKNIFLLKKILDKFNVQKVSIISKPISTEVLYNVYVGGFYSYPKILKFAKVLKSKGYKTYGIKNINLKYYVLIDKLISIAKKRAYQKAWSATPYNIFFKKIKIKKLLYIARFVSPDYHLIKVLKKRGFSTIIKKIENGA